MFKSKLWEKLILIKVSAQRYFYPKMNQDGKQSEIKNIKNHNR